MEYREFRQKSGIRTGTRLLLCLLFAVVLLLPAPAAVGAVPNDPPEESGDILEDSDNTLAILYDNTNGLPSTEANAIAETEEGFLWIGSYSGLVRYDGNSFEQIGSEYGITSVKCLYAGEDGRLWIGTNDTGLFLMERGEFRRWTETDGLGSNSVRALGMDADGNIYAGTTKGVVMITPDLEMVQIEDARVREAFVSSMNPVLDGSVLVLAASGDFFTLLGGRLTDYLSEEESNIKDITCIMPDTQNPGYVYVESAETDLFYGRLDGNFEDMESIDIAPLSQIQEFKQIDGNLWICTRTGIGLLNEDGLRIMNRWPMNNSVGHVIKDYQGNLWFTSTRQGVMKIVSNRFTKLNDIYGMPEEVVNSTCFYNGQLLIAGDTGLSVIGKDGPVYEFPITETYTASGQIVGHNDLIQMLKGVRIRSILRDSKNRLWISTWRTYGLLCYDNGTVTIYDVRDGLFSDRVRAIYECRDGSVLVAVTGGVNVIRDGVVTESYGIGDGIDNTETLTVCEGRDGEILVGSDGGGIYIIRDGALYRHIGTQEGLTSGAIMRITYDRMRGVYWVVSGNALVRLDRDFSVHTVTTFPYYNNFVMYENHKGEIWVLGGDGIYVVSAADMMNDNCIRYMHFETANGLPSIATSNSYSELTEDGDLYIASRSGVVRVNIDAPFENVSKLKIAIPYIEADGKTIYPDENGEFTAGADTRKLTIYPYVFNYSLTDPQVFYYLDGFDETGMAVRRSDLDPVSYTNLKGGEYSFVLTLRDSLGMNENTVSAKIVKKKAYYEEPLFYAALTALAIWLVHLVIKYRVGVRMHKVEQQHREEMEKEKVRNEMQTANQIQASMLPHTFPPFPERNEFEIYAYNDPAREVGGDFYDYFFTDKDHLCIVMADVSGKGIPAALFMMGSMIVLRNSAKLGLSPSEILIRTNEGLCENNQAEMFVTAWVGILDVRTGHVEAANAGHEYPAIMHNGKYELFKDKHGFVLGGMKGVRYRQYGFDLEPGDRLFLYTDGLPEATDREEEMFGTERMIETLNSDLSATSGKTIQNIRSAVSAFVNDAEQFDDLTILCMIYKGPQGTAEEQE